MAVSGSIAEQLAPPSPELAAVEERLRADIASHRLKLPVLPNVAMEVLSSSLDDGQDAARLAGLVQKDQSLATHMLRIVNSPAFRGATEIVALQQAIARLGMVRIREIALTASLKNAMSCKGSFQELMDDAWRLGLATGMWAKEFARATRRNVENAYLGGLLHNIGDSLIAVELCTREPGLREGDARYLMAVLGREAGETLTAAWQLPPLIGTCIRYVGHFAEADANQDDVASVECGHAAAVAMLQDTLSAETLVQLDAVQHLNLYPEDVEDVLTKSAEINVALESMVL
ncbi:MAG: HDOD domain-containing protein [Pseudomonadales bacterium]|nr:HDOD domain-containing protein [Pseudomonadales bacterium]MCP5184855.1 HDOD domain-containing protein [Pseudomonadales bacterium]